MNAKDHAVEIVSRYVSSVIQFDEDARLDFYTHVGESLDWFSHSEAEAESIYKSIEILVGRFDEPIS